MQFIDLKTQQDRIRPQIDAAMERVLSHGRYIMGPEIAELEAQLALYTGSKHCVGVSSGTDALLIAMMALGVKPGSEVITTPFTFFATAEMIMLMGAEPVFVDIKSDTYNIDPKFLEDAITDRTSAIMPVDLYGQCADYDEINAIASKHGLPVIGDAAQSFGATYKGARSCSLSTIGCTSFFPSKPLGCYGDGGACFTDDDDLAQAMREILKHGQSARYQHTRLGINGRLDTMQAAILLAKMEIFEEEVELRQQVANRYRDLLNDSNSESAVKDITAPYIESFNKSVFAQYTVKVNNRDQIQVAMREAGIPTAVHYPIPVNKQPVMAQSEESMMHADECSKVVMSLPMHPYLEEQDQQRIIQALFEA